MDPTLYLERIRYTKDVKPDAETLHELQRAHMQAVPFENLDIGLKRPIRIDEESLWEKLIHQRRGGFCYELNGLFAWLLKKIGFDVTYLNARVFDRAGNPGIEFDHLALLVRVPDDPEHWLVDVGFGDSFIQPLSFERPGEQPQGLRAYRLEQRGEGFVVWQRNYAGAWERQYVFDLQPRNFPQDYEAACRYHQTSPQSIFTRNRIISRLTANGRVSLDNNRLIVTTNGQREEVPIKDDDFPALLKQHFDVTL